MLREGAESRTMQLEVLNREFQTRLGITDPAAISAVISTIVADRLTADPLWLMLIGPPGCGKGEIIEALSGVTRSLTAALPGLTAGTPSFSPPLLPASRPGLIVPATEDVLDHPDFVEILGDCFFYLRIRQPDAEKLATQFAENLEANRAKLRAAVEKFLGALDLGVLPDLTSKLRQRIKSAARAFPAASRARQTRQLTVFSRAALICGVEDVGGLVERLTQVKTSIAAGVVERPAGKVRASQ